MRRLVLLLTCTTTIYACSCAFLGTMHEAFCLSDYVTHAKIAAKLYSDDGMSINYIVEHVAVYRKPDDLFQLPMTITSPSELPACGVELDVNEEYLLGGRILDDGSLRITSCGLIRKWDEFSEKSKKELRTYTCEKEDSNGSNLSPSPLRNESNLSAIPLRNNPLMDLLNLLYSLRSNI